MPPRGQQRDNDPILEMEVFGIFEGGGAKGYAHIGALRAAEERRIKFRAVAGTSAGAIVASLIAAGYSSKELYGPADNPEAGLLSRRDPITLLDPDEWKSVRSLGRHLERLSQRKAPKYFPDLSRNAFFVTLYGIGAYIWHRPLLQRLRKHFGAANTAPIRAWLDDALRTKLGVPQGEEICFRHLTNVSLKVITADLSSQKLGLFGNAEHANVSVVDAVLASASIPFVFQPQTFADRIHVDGGLLSNHPAWVFDRERASLPSSIPTLGFKLIDLPVNVPQAEITSLASFCLSVARTAIFGASALESRLIDDYYEIDLTNDVGVLAFDDAADRGFQLVEEARVAALRFLDREIGPRDPEEMSIVLSAVATEIKRSMDLSLAPRAFIVMPFDADFFRISYSAGMQDDADDQIRLRRDSLGPALCFQVREPVLTRTTKIPPDVRANPLWKREHGCRPASVKTVYSCPIFRDPEEWRKVDPTTRAEPIAVFAFDCADDIALKLQDTKVEDRLASLTQLVGEQLKGRPLVVHPAPAVSEPSGPAWQNLHPSGAFCVSARKERALLEDDGLISVAMRAESRVHKLRGDDDYRSAN
jgi:NTE family protein